LQRIISVVGLGYVGLPLAVAFGRAGRTIGFDISARRIHRLYVLIFFLIIPAYAHAVTYYVDATAGNDNYHGTTIDAPWKTIAKVNGRTFQPGDSVLFKRGCTWREQLTVPSSGTEGNPITFGAYGTGDKPVISGADIVGSNSWSLYSGNIYVTKVGSITPPNQLYVDGKFYDIAHYPNSGWLLATAKSSDTTSIIDAHLTLKADQIVGATVMTKAVPWSITSSTATTYDPATHKITLNAPVFDTSLVMRTGYGYYLTNKLWMLDSPGEWYYNPASGRLYLWMAGSDNPSGHVIEVSNRSYGVYNNNKNYFTITDLAVTKANQNDVHMYSGHYITVTNLDISGGKFGIYFTGIYNSSIQNNSVQNTLADGIREDGTLNTIDISNNTVNNAGNVGSSPKQSGGGLHIGGTNINVANNNITNSGYDGICFDGNTITVKNNVINRSCLVLNDCAGIYTGGMGSRSTSKTIIGNTVTNSIGNYSGTPNTSTNAHGIYLDDGTHDTTVSGNNISNISIGIYIHTGHNNTVTGNKVYSARMNGILINEAGVAATSVGVVHDNVVTGNTFESISTNATTYYYSLIDASTNFGTYNYNQYYHPNSNYVVKNQNLNYTLPAWQQASGQDLNSTDSKSYAPRTGTNMNLNLRVKKVAP
jgi:parallel beta-helix repeat protein